ncbi:MAG: imidazole glycerol phosphate synthase subunit HisF [Porticoccaceae bacterium]
MKKRIIARIDVKNESAIKGIHLEGLRKIGDPNNLALNYYNSGVDEVIFMDAVAAYYDRNSLSEIIQRACNDVFVPITVGGGIRTLSDVQSALNAGADKVALNTQSIRTPEFISHASKIFGSQCIVASVEAKRNFESDSWNAYYDNGREDSGMDVISWVKELESLGAGEIFITSVDKEGTKKGFDVNLLNEICNAVNIPVVASGGAGSIGHVQELLSTSDASGVALASLLHYEISTIKELKKFLIENKIKVRV